MSNVLASMPYFKYYISNQQQVFKVVKRDSYQYFFFPSVSYIV